MQGASACFKLLYRFFRKTNRKLLLGFEQVMYSINVVHTIIFRIRFPFITYSIRVKQVYFFVNIQKKLTKLDIDCELYKVYKEIKNQYGYFRIFF